MKKDSMENGFWTQVKRKSRKGRMHIFYTYMSINTIAVARNVSLCKVLGFFFEIGSIVLIPNYYYSFNEGELRRSHRASFRV